MYALNIRKGTVINHPLVELQGLIAVPVSDELANQLKNIHNVVVFDKIAGIKERIKSKDLYGLDKETLEIKNG